MQQKGVAPVELIFAKGDSDLCDSDAEEPMLRCFLMICSTSTLSKSLTGWGQSNDDSYAQLVLDKQESDLGDKGRDDKVNEGEDDGSDEGSNKDDEDDKDDHEAEEQDSKDRLRLDFRTALEAVSHEGVCLIFAILLLDSS
ncbi:MAG: hypothetical protein CYPHOPRED_002879 [Cyphobasidiales sp. Tagirdzhanova-0007]|nr:MAG: hypothetical protein CYPHOPRED_002879 [Cyphobasidiales sp. Tagirdzhanova-0007]